MSRQRLIGVDLNGVDDRLAVAESDGSAECVELGVRGSLVHLLAEQRWIAGGQNEAAPHGRGPAWGEVGSAEHRIELLALFERLRTAEAGKQEADAFASALPDLTRDKGRAVFATPDVPDWGEAFRDRYLRLLTHAGGPRPLLLWRPVAALLGRLADRPEGPGDGATVAVLSLMADGAHLALLTLECEDVSLPVPVRRQAGVAADASFRGERLVEDALRRLDEMFGLPKDDIRASAWAPWRLAIGAEPRKELLRLAENRGWRALPDLDHRPPVPDSSDLRGEALRLLDEAALLLVEGPFAGNATWRDAVLAAFGRRTALPTQIECLEASTVARGCLEAARRDREGQPIYFDFLPQLQINALVEGRPEFVDLIAHGERCQGGQVFRAPAADRYAINRGASQFVFWLFKEDFEHGRKAEVPLPETADRRYALTVEVSQTPGQGFAEVTISSSEFDTLRRRPIRLNWAKMQETSETREQILEKTGKLSGGALAWPETAVIRGHPMHWSETHRRGSLLALLVAYRRKPLVWNGAIHEPTRALLNQLRQRFSASVDSRRALRSDGALPDPEGNLAVPPGARRELDLTLDKLDQDFAALQRSFGFLIEPGILGDVVGFASWCFWRCPPGIADLLLDVYGGQMRHRVNHLLLREGVARSAGSRDRLERYFTAVERRFEIVNALAAAEFAGLARALGTAPEAAVVLGGQLADRLLEEARKALEAENRMPQQAAYKRRFKSALLMLSALLRHRKRRGDFVDPEGSGGQQLLTLLEATRQRNLQFAEEYRAPPLRWTPAAKRMERNVEILDELHKFVRLQGSDPNIIERIEAMQDD